MPRPKTRTRQLILGVGLMACVVLGTAAAWPLLKSRPRKVQAEGVERVEVRRLNLDAMLTAGGRVESLKKTLIECELENLRYSNEGRSISAGSPEILEVIPEGTTVRRDDVLCRLDSSGYEELVIQQEIKLRQAKNDHDKAELDVKSAELALGEYRDGTLPQQLQAIEGQIVMARADLTRQGDRLTWAATMLKNGYYSGAQMSSERDRMLRAEVTLANALGEQRVTSRFRAPMMIRRLETAVENAKSMLAYHDLKLRRTEVQLEKFRKQVSLCTVKAPHDGFVIYATDRGNASKVEVGAVVHQKMDLFFLPDLGNMEVQAVLNETVVNRVKPNMPVRVRVEGLPQYAIEGHVVSVSPLPILRKEWGAVSDIKSYLGKIQLHSSPQGLMPGMTAEVEIQTAHSQDALVVPAESVLAENGRDYCLVENAGGLERREVTVGQGSRELLEIRSGLAEGEIVVRDPSLLNDEDEAALALQPAPIVNDEWATMGK